MCVCVCVYILISVLWELQILMFKKACYLGLILGSFSKCLTVKRLEPETYGPGKHIFQYQKIVLQTSFPVTTGDGLYLRFMLKEEEQVPFRN